MKKISIVLVMLMVLVGCSTKPQEKEPYIEFNADEFYLEYGSEFDPLSIDYIKDYQGVISYVGDLDTEIPGEYILNYSITNDNGKNEKDYKITFVVEEEISNDTITYFNSLEDNGENDMFPEMLIISVKDYNDIKNSDSIMMGEMWSGTGSYSINVDIKKISENIFSFIVKDYYIAPGLIEHLNIHEGQEFYFILIDENEIELFCNREGTSIKLEDVIAGNGVIYNSNIYD